MSLTDPVALQQILTEKLALYGFEYVGGEFAVHQGRQSWRLYIDLPGGGITIGQLGEASRLLVDELRLNGVDTQFIHLEVSSPGIDRILFTLAQCQQFVGKKVKVKLKQPVQGQRKYQGLLESVQADAVSVQTAEQENVVIPWWVVAQIRLVPDISISMKKVKT